MMRYSFDKGSHTVTKLVIERIELVLERIKLVLIVVVLVKALLINGNFHYPSMNELQLRQLLNQLQLLHP